MMRKSNFLSQLSDRRSFDSRCALKAAELKFSKVANVQGSLGHVETYTVIMQSCTCLTDHAQFCACLAESHAAVRDRQIQSWATFSDYRFYAGQFSRHTYIHARARALRKAAEIYRIMRRTCRLNEFS